MRLHQVLIVVTASMLFTCEALSATAYSDTLETSSGDPTKRLLRTQHTFAEVNDENVDEERKLDAAKMARMSKSGMTAKGYAKKLNIDEILDAALKMSAETRARFMGTHKYQKYIKYFNYLQDKKSGYN
ncbi:RxLR effector protein [Phytophthora megakarya]|uniref:RxLR effector protein n=1 Tax=Phytophthora megakarya TaxID=4795 RepID=A0A225WDP2_9STRA|nr:RxLR effector protein [Phytophthora megakarya]